MKETTPPKDPKKKLWIGYAVILVLLLLGNIFLFPAMMQAQREKRSTTAPSFRCWRTSS